MFLSRNKTIAAALVAVLAMLPALRVPPTGTSRSAPEPPPTVMPAILPRRVRPRWTQIRAIRRRWALRRPNTRKLPRALAPRGHTPRPPPRTAYPRGPPIPH